MSDITIRPHFDANGKDFAVERVQDCTPILEWNAEARRDDQPSDWGRHVARIPNIILLKWLDEAHARGQVGVRLFSAEFNELVQKKLQDPDWAYLRTAKASLQVGFH